MLLLHEFHGRKFLLPDKLTARERDALARRDAEDAGEDAPAETAGAGVLSTRCAHCRWLRMLMQMLVGSVGSRHVRDLPQ